MASFAKTASDKYSYILRKYHQLHKLQGLVKIIVFLLLLRNCVKVKAGVEQGRTLINSERDPLLRNTFLLPESCSAVAPAKKRGGSATKFGGKSWFHGSEDLGSRFLPNIGKIQMMNQSFM